jgi:hypothetical protein
MLRSQDLGRFAVCALALLCAGALAGCVSRPRPSPPARSAADPAFERADAECRESAARETAAVTPQGQASKAAIGIDLECMSGKGFASPGR